MRQARRDQLHRYHDCNAKETSFNVGDLVLRCIQKTDGMHKLSAPCEGPFIVTEVISPSTYRLQWGDRQGVPNPWNVEHLHRFYPYNNSFKFRLCISLSCPFFRLNKLIFQAVICYE
jgi:hypothetical protein